MKRFLLSMTIVSVLVVGAGLIAVAGSLDQQDGANHLSFNGFSFSFDLALAENVNITHFAGDPLDFQAPGGPEVAHTAYTLYNGMMSPESWLDAVGGLRLYRTADFAGYEFPTQRLEELQRILDERPDLATYSVEFEAFVDSVTLPFMPIFPASQAIRGQAHYVDTDAVSGIAYVTVYRQDASPLMADEFIYTFQGISHDGNYYVSALMRVNASVFPSELPADFNYDDFINNFTTYMSDSTSLLNSAAAIDFTPSLTLLDEVVESISFAE